MFAPEATSNVNGITVIRRLFPSVMTVLALARMSGITIWHFVQLGLMLLALARTSGITIWHFVQLGLMLLAINSPVPVSGITIWLFVQLGLIAIGTRPYLLSGITIWQFCTDDYYYWQSSDTAVRIGSPGYSTQSNISHLHTTANYGNGSLALT
jgi:hypothetical protein